jgi:hypothetical protein
VLGQPIEWNQVIKMKTHAHSSKAENAGVRVGRAWRGLLRRENKFVAWLSEQGLPVYVASGLIWIIKLSLLVAVLCFSLTVGALVTALLIIAHILSHADLSDSDDRPRWRNGLMGFGLYRNGIRIDPHDLHDGH